jgi:hypothetical protein
MERTVTRTRNDSADDVVVLSDAAAPRSRIRWAAVFAGMVLSVGLLVLLSSLWLAIAYGSDEAFVVRNLEWFVGASAVGCLLIGGFLAGGCPGSRSRNRTRARPDAVGPHAVGRLGDRSSHR